MNLPKLRNDSSPAADPTAESACVDGAGCQPVVFPFSFNIALWPVWAFFTPLLLFTQFMGLVMFISLLG